MQYPRMVGPRKLALLLLALVAFQCAPTFAGAPPARPFERLSGCTIKPHAFNDGDSFHVLLADGREHIFRLYFVDTPEIETTYAERSADQAAYFGLTPEATVALAREAADFTRRALAKPFTVHTRWNSALGRSKLPRYYAVIVTADGQDLAQMLVAAGLARIYGTRTPLPDGSNSRVYLTKLTGLEATAKGQHRGAWRRP